MTRTHKIGYIADYPIYGEPAAINAFAKGAAITDPYARIILCQLFLNNGNALNEIIFCGADMTTGHDGLYMIGSGTYNRICGSKIVKSIGGNSIFVFLRNI